MFDCQVTALKVHGCTNIRARDDAAIAAIEGVLQQALPRTPNQLSLGEHRIYWLGPDEWLVLSDQAVLAALARVTAGRFVAINDQVGGMRVLRVDGPEVQQLLNAGCPLDLSPAVLGRGGCAQSTLAKSNIVLGCIDDAPVYEIIVRRSFSEYLQSWLRRHTTDLPDSVSC